ncbi:MAG: restriction endonuclease subunit S [Bacteroidota bacterium]|nr:restriction endonuclease subunit S [Bacteroidota bacterium]
MSKVKSYPLYSDFNQEWLGELPSHWKVMRTKFLFNLVTEPAPIGNSEELLSVYTALGVKPRKEMEARGNKASSTDNYWRVEQGDIIVNKLLAWMGAVGISEYNGVTSPAYDILRAKENANPYFYNYLFRNPIASREFKRHSRGIMDMRLRLYFTRFGDIKLPQPPIEEQGKIVDYLQYKLKKIDRFIRKKKQLIKLLNEQKTAIINNAVTKGLDSNAKMKPSGVEWLGDIPEHWEVKRLKYLAKICNGSDCDKKETGKYPVYGSGGVFGRTNAFLYDKVSVLLGRKGTVDKPQFVEEPFWTVDTAFYTKIKESEIVPIFLYYLCCSIPFGFYSSKTALPSMTQTSLYQVKLTVPPKHEQNDILRFINDQVDVFQKTISTIEKEIALTQEYKIVIIAEAVTGKIDVRDFEIPETLVEECYEELEEELNFAAEDEAEYKKQEME